MKICSVCNIEKDLSQFYTWTWKGEVKPRASCKDCQKKRSQVWHSKNKDAVCERSKRNREIRNDKARAYIIEYLTQHPCVDCDERNLMKLEFDHLGDKETAIAKLLQQSAALSRIIKEINKCEVVCANCHRVRTYTRNKSYRWRAENERESKADSVR